MCGICAIASHEDVSEKMLVCLQRLEYRGYDSCGMAVHDGQQINLRKNTGGVDQVNEEERFAELIGSIGIAHTRWATHGGVTAANSHPHFSNDKQFVIVHNGIISNYQSIKADLKSKGYQFYSETDSESFVNLVHFHFQTEQNVEKSFLKAIQEIQGSFAIALLSTHEPSKLYAVKKESPLVIGLDDGTSYLSSDINAFISETRDAVLIDDHEYVILERDSYQIKSIADQSIINKEIMHIDWDQETAQKGGYSHYMIKEIFDQPQTFRNAMNIPLEDLEPVVDLFLNKQQSFFVGVGTTYFVAMVGTYLFSEFAKTYIPAVSADEFESLIPLESDMHTLFLSQSGETYDTRMAVKAAQKAGGGTTAIVNVVGSSISQMVDHCVFQSSGPEICVVSTKAALSQMILLYRLALRTGEKKGVLSAEKRQAAEQDVIHFASQVETILNEQSGFIRQLANMTSHVHNWLFMGKGIYYPVAMESALKMKEVTYLHAEGLPSGFLKHGTLAMVDATIYSLFFMPGKEDADLYHSTLMAIEEVKARDGVVIGFCHKDDEEAVNLMDYHFKLPEVTKEMTPFLELIIAQLFSYYSALHLKRSIDKPRNLAKSVTVG